MLPSVTAGPTFDTKTVRVNSMAAPVLKQKASLWNSYRKHGQKGVEMPSFSPKLCKSKPWRARRKRDEIEFFLGYFATKEEAEEEEASYDRAYPPKIRRTK